MKLTKELYEVGKNSKGVFTPVNEDFGLVCKSMPVTDEELDMYIAAITRAKVLGINVAGIVDYRMIPGTTNSYGTSHGVVSYTKGVFLEDRAKGVSLGNNAMYVTSSGNYDYSKLVIDYLRKFIDYISELERRAEASQEVFDKLVKDCVDLQKCNLMIDPKPTNFFYHPEYGFTIIDVIGMTEKMKSIKADEYFPAYVYSMVLGYGEPSLYIDKKRYFGLPVEYQDRLYKALTLLEVKMIQALYNNGIDGKFISSNIDRQGYRFVNGYTDVNLEDIETEVFGIVEDNRKKRSTSTDTEIVDINKLVIQ